jgi:hypothetical protein
MEPANGLDDVRRLADSEETCEFFKPVLDELSRHGLDDDDLREIIRSELGDGHCFRGKPTEKYHPQTTSDYYSIWINECGSRMFIKLLIAHRGTVRERLVVTSFKKDDRYDR